MIFNAWKVSQRTCRLRSKQKQNNYNYYLSKKPMITYEASLKKQRLACLDSRLWSQLAEESDDRWIQIIFVQQNI